MISWNVL
jgi:hypothetical protein